MNADCQWTEQHLEGFFCDTLSPEEDRRTRGHLELCLQCREKVEDLRSVDPLIQKLFQQNLVIARSPRQRRSPIMVGAFATSVALAVLLIVSLLPQQLSNPPADQPVIVSQPTPEPDPVPKVPETAPIERAKPDTTATDQPVSPPAKSATTDGPPPAFVVIDPSGYVRTLNDYRSYVLIFGVWSADQPQTISNLERIYQTFGPNTKLRIVGVSNDRRPKPANASFPIAFNQGSALLGAKPGEFLVVDGSGVVRNRGSLLQDSSAILNTIRTGLTSLGIRGQ